MTKTILTCCLVCLLPIEANALTVDKEEYGVTGDGHKVFQYVLANDTGFTVKVLNYGGVITDIDVPDKQGSLTHVVLKLASLRAYEERPNFSALIGRFANRIGQGGITLDEHFYPLRADARGIISHGGQGALSTKVWDAETYVAKHESGVRMSYTSPDGENGFPGELTVTATFSVDNKNQLTIRYQATTSKKTVVNLTHHLFFNLDGWGSTADHLVRINAGYYLPINNMKLVTGDMDPVDGTPFDLRKSVAIAKGLASSQPQLVMANGYDHNFVLNKKRPGEMSLAAQLLSIHSGIGLTVYTTEPGLQFYTGNNFDGRLLDWKQRPILRNYGIALETQHYPDSPHHDNFPATVLSPGEVLISETIYQFHARPAKR